MKGMPGARPEPELQPAGQQLLTYSATAPDIPGDLPTYLPTYDEAVGQFTEVSFLITLLLLCLFFLLL